ncbi:maleylpyruvate isomerase family mycothiol-dependent enzyme [Streptomyces sp. NP160]|uniref:maleylpyruvate isomerase N-terminal domain-containing protein n=1 Tax=Streptomyces sp. NP160 TaxID=2586637 RepID=UPI001119CB83|nr:maleylpyruvate isomerase N-terminal domain-containing protein [Streptomyces sp. NP160]TNM68196.1 maleylpyruvate isomerase family mycothiol-dependent enzyme [Streptomyces sp. NP160]
MQNHRAADLVEREAAALAALLAPGALQAPVPACPGWSLVDLARHTGGVHRWAAAALAAPPDGDPGDEPGGPEDDSEVRGWFTAGAAALVAALRATPPTRPCWTFAVPEAPATAAFWGRRQVLETALHRWDAESALAAAGLGAAPDPAAWLEDGVAADGVAEVADVVLPRQVRLGRTPPLPGALALQSTSGRCVLGQGSEPAAELTGPAPALLLLLWRRTALEAELASGRLALAGSREAADRLLSGALTP